MGGDSSNPEPVSAISIIVCMQRNQFGLLAAMLLLKHIYIHPPAIITQLSTYRNLYVHRYLHIGTVLLSPLPLPPPPPQPALGHGLGCPPPTTHLYRSHPTVPGCRRPRAPPLCSCVLLFFRGSWVLPGRSDLEVAGCSPWLFRFEPHLSQPGPLPLEIEVVGVCHISVDYTFYVLYYI